MPHSRSDQNRAGKFAEQAAHALHVACTTPQTLLPPGTNEPPNLDLSILMDLPATNGSSKQRPQSPLRSKSPDAELAALVTAIQATNSRVREVNHLMEENTSNVAHLQVSIGTRLLLFPAAAVAGRTRWYRTLSVCSSVCNLCCTFNITAWQAVSNVVLSGAGCACMKRCGWQDWMV